MSLAIQVFFLSVLFASVILKGCVAVMGKKCSLWVKAGILNGSGQMDTFVMSMKELVDRDRDREIAAQLPSWAK